MASNGGHGNRTGRRRREWGPTPSRSTSNRHPPFRPDFPIPILTSQSNPSPAHAQARVCVCLKLARNFPVPAAEVFRRLCDNARPRLAQRVYRDNPSEPERIEAKRIRSARSLTAPQRPQRPCTRPTMALPTMRLLPSTTTRSSSNNSPAASPDSRSCTTSSNSLPAWPLKEPLDLARTLK